MNQARRLMWGAAAVAFSVGGCGIGDSSTAPSDTTEVSQPSVSSVPSQSVAGPTVVVSSSGPPTSAEGSTPSGEPVDQLPFDEQIELALGFDSAAARAAVDRAVIERASECLSDKGWEVQQDTFAQFETRPERLDGVAESAQAMIRRGPQAKDSRWADPTFGRTAMECFTDATEQVANPFSVVNEQLENATEEISERVEADPRYQAASVENAKCLAAAGYDEDELGRLQLAESEQASSIVQAYMSKSINQDDALAQIDVVVDSAAPWRLVVDRCAAPWDEVEVQLVAEYQEQYLNDNPGLIDQAAASAAEAQRQIEPFLEAG